MRRRTVVKAGITLSGSLLLNLHLTSPSHASPDQNAPENKQADTTSPLYPDGHLEITADNRLLFSLNRFEMGQGVASSLPILLAEELKVAPTQLEVFTPTLNGSFKASPHASNSNPLYQAPSTTAGSDSIRSSWHNLRAAGANIRQLMLNAAAQSWDIDAENCHTKNGVVFNRLNQQSITFGQLISIAKSLPLPTGQLTPATELQYIGKPVLTNDLVKKVTGSLVYGTDQQFEKTLIAIVLRRINSKSQHTLNSKLQEQLLALPGIRKVFPIPTGIAIIAEHYWAAEKARKLAIKSHTPDNTNTERNGLNSHQINKRLEKAIQSTNTIRDFGDANELLSDTTTETHSASYSVPFLAHAPMEPLSCSIAMTSEQCDIWTATQAPRRVLQLAIKETGLSPDKIHLHTLPVGGSFGRRLSLDFILEAIQITKALNPAEGHTIKVIWSREDDIQFDHYRPAIFSKMEAAFDPQEKLGAWRHQIVTTQPSPSTSSNELSLAGIKKSLWKLKQHFKTGISEYQTVAKGAITIPYNIQNIEIKTAFTDEPISTGSWRSISHSFNAFFVESFIDELAHFKKQDPYLFRKHYMTDNPRLLSTLNLAAQKSGWPTASQKGRALGIATHISFGTSVTQVVEISLSPSSSKNSPQQIRVHRVVCVVDCGVVVNPDGLKAQIEGGIIYGLSAALHGQITIGQGKVEQSNFHDYPVLRMNETPEIEIHTIQSKKSPTGMGEPATPPIAPAVANAVFALTGKRLRSLPLTLMM